MESLEPKEALPESIFPGKYAITDIPMQLQTFVAIPFYDDSLACLRLLYFILLNTLKKSTRRQLGRVFRWILSISQNQSQQNPHLNLN